jgi:hypothetical protein
MEAAANGTLHGVRLPNPETLVGGVIVAPESARRRVIARVIHGNALDGYSITVIILRLRAAS